MNEHDSYETIDWEKHNAEVSGQPEGCYEESHSTHN